MRDWTSTLLEKDLASYALVNIIDGVLKYAIGRHSPEAVDQASHIAADIEDTTLRTQQFERIAECFVKVGCVIFEESTNENREKFESGFHSFERGLEIIKQIANFQQLSLKIAGMIDIILTYSRTNKNSDYVIVLAMYSIEIQNSFERDAMMHRIISNLNSDIPHPNSTDPYEIISYLLQKNNHANDKQKISELISDLVGKIYNPFIKLSGFCTLANMSIQSNNYERAHAILNSVYESLPELPAEYEKVIILSDLTILFCRIDTKIANVCLQNGIKYLDNIEVEKDAIVRKQIVLAAANLYEVNRDEDLKEIASQIAYENCRSCRVYSFAYGYS